MTEVSEGLKKKPYKPVRNEHPWKKNFKTTIFKNPFILKDEQELRELKEITDVPINRVLTESQMQTLWYLAKKKKKTFSTTFREAVDSYLIYETKKG